MRISELIQKLEEFKSGLGDVQVSDTYGNDDFTLEYDQDDDVLILCDKA